MKKISIFTCVLLGALVGAGCGSSEATATKKDEDSFRNPPKTMPKEAQEAMARMGSKGGPPPAAGTAGTPPATTGG